MTGWHYNPCMSASTTAPAATSKPKGCLWVVATPIGHLDDLSPRGRALLHSVAVIAAEDTRISRRLIEGREAKVRWVVLNEQSEAKAVADLIECLIEGQSVALVSDAGTPLISDPGYRLVAAAHQAGIQVSPVPGPCAAVAALSAAGLPSDRFVFEGFLPAKAGARRQRLMALGEQPNTLIFYVPARDLPVVLQDMAECLGGQRLATLGRELTKLHETVRRDALAALQAWCAQDADQQRGEAVVVVAGSTTPMTQIAVAELTRELAQALPPSQAAAMLARLTDLSRREAFALVEQQRA